MPEGEVNAGRRDIPGGIYREGYTGDTPSHPVHPWVHRLSVHLMLYPEHCYGGVHGGTVVNNDLLGSVLSAESG